MPLLSTSGLPSFPTANGNLPSENSRSVPLSCSWASTASYSGDLFDIVESGQLSLIQSVFIDNSQVYGPVALTFNGTGQRIVVPAGGQGYFPVFVAGGTQFTLTGGDQKQPFAQILGGNTTVVWVNNFPMPAACWNAAGIMSQNFRWVNNVNIAAGATFNGASAIATSGWRSMWLSIRATGVTTPAAGDYVQLQYNNLAFRSYGFTAGADGGGIEIDAPAGFGAVPIPDGVSLVNITIHNAEAVALTVNAEFSALLTA